MVFSKSTGLHDTLKTVVDVINDGSNFLSSQSNVESIIARPQYGKFTRQVVHWRVPHIGWVKMFLNPKQMVISEEKQIESVRTKGGFIVQYGGENLTKIAISGSTGSAGIEGINILREIYRAEQIAFDTIAFELERSGPLAQAARVVQGVIDESESSNSPTQSFGSQAASDFIQSALNPNGQPFTTLASLAVNIEMYFQGETFRGFFKDFSVTESGESPGIFEYTLNFIAHSRQGTRRNFMAWHRQPYNPVGLSNNEANPLSFIGQNQLNTIIDSAEKLKDSVISFASGGKNNKRSLASGSGNNGNSLTDINLEDLL